MSIVRPADICGMALSFLILSPSGCSKVSDHLPVYSVRGKVLLGDKPAAGALVLFHAKTDANAAVPRPHGRVAQDGTFSLSTYEAEDGAPAGDYVVTIDWRKDLPAHVPGAPKLLPTRYSAPHQSPLRATVEPADNQLQPFQLSRP